MNQFEELPTDPLDRHRTLLWIAEQYGVPGNLDMAEKVHDLERQIHQLKVEAANLRTSVRILSKLCWDYINQVN